MSVKIFLSTVSDEFRAYRDQLRTDLTRHNVEVKVQEDLKDLGRGTLDELDTYIANCDAVVHLVGHMTGAAPGARDVSALLAKYSDLTDDLPPLGKALKNGESVSYTQWEAWLALYHRKDLFITQAAESAERGPRYAPTDVSRTAQADHLKRLRESKRYPGFTFTNPIDLANYLKFTGILDLLVKAYAEEVARARDVAEEFIYEIAEKVAGDRKLDFEGMKQAVRNALDIYERRAPETVRRRLANYLTRFIGRGDELRNLEQCLLSDQRLVTLVGVTGLGKTRLALKAVADVAGEFAGGVSYVDLVDASGAALREVVTSAITSDLGLTGDLDEVMRSRHALLMLDTCDRQVESCRHFIKRLLQNSANLRILAACQQPLEIGGEQKFELQPLRAPTREQLDAVRAKDTSAESFREMDAVRLFVDRVRNQRYDYEPGPEDLLHIGDICHRLEGIPVLIEMAARRMRGSPAQLAAKLKESLAMPDEHHPPRQQTVHAMLDWMYQSLECDEERQLLRRLSVFAGGWTQAAAEAVAGGKPLSVEAVNHWLDRLMDKSMVTIERSADPLRYRMLRTVRDDASARLKETVEAHEVRTRHFDYYLAQAEASQPYHPGAREATWLATLEVEHNNLRTAFEWAVANQKTTRALKLAGALFWFWNFRGYIQEGRLRTEQALALKPARASRARARALYAAGTLAFLGNDRVTGLTHLKASEQMARTQRDERVLAYALTVLGLLRADERPAEGWAREEALGPHEEALGLFQRLSDRWGEALARHDLANVLSCLGEGEAARTQYEESRRGFRAAGSQWGQALALNDLGAIAMGDRRYPEAREYFREAAELHRALQNKLYLAATLIRLGYLEKARDPREALALFRETMRLAHQIDNELMLADSIFNIAQLAHDTGRPRQAACLLAALQAQLDAKPDAPGFNADEFERWKAQARASLDAATFEGAWREGRALSLAQAWMYALQDA